MALLKVVGIIVFLLLEELWRAAQFTRSDSSTNHSSDVNNYFSSEDYSSYCALDTCVIKIYNITNSVGEIT